MEESLTVLMVEDDRDDALLVQHELRRTWPDLRWIRVETRAEMEAALIRSAPDVVLSDVKLPRFSAREALLVQRALAPQAPFIILSGAVKTEDVVVLFKAGAVDFVEKHDLARLGPAIERERRECLSRLARREAENTLRKLSMAVEQSPASVIIVDRRGIIEYVNPRFIETTGYFADEAVGRSLHDTGCECAALLEAGAIEAAEGRPWQAEVRSRCKDGRLLWEKASVAPMRGEDGMVSHYVVVREDISVRKEYEDLLIRQALHDPLTGLPNRRLVLERLSQSIAEADAGAGQVAVLFFDMDRFKHINDSFGHATGDAVLVEAAARLSEAVGPADTAGRLGGDDFVVVLPNLADLKQAEIVADRIVASFNRPFMAGGVESYATISIGIAVHPQDGADGETLIRNADFALYAAKERGTSSISRFAIGMRKRAEDRLLLEQELRRGFEKRRFRMDYQPIVDLRHGIPVGAEALMRYDGESGPVPPSQFIPLAEESGLIVPLGHWALETACGRVAALGALLPEQFRVAVNVSSRQMRQGGIVRDVIQVLERTGIGPERLELEITESALMDDGHEVSRALDEISAMGIRLSIDDFGTGYSSLSYLRRFPFHTLKIDKSFVQDVTVNRESAKLVDAIMAMADSLSLAVVAEGIETREQCDFFRERDCALAQGYFFCKPMREDGIERYLRDAVKEPAGGARDDF